MVAYKSCLLQDKLPVCLSCEAVTVVCFTATTFVSRLISKRTILMRDSAAAGDGCVSFHPKHSGSISHIAGAKRVSGLKRHLSAVGTLLKNRQKGALQNVL